MNKTGIPGAGNLKRTSPVKYQGLVLHFYLFTNHLRITLLINHPAGGNITVLIICIRQLAYSYALAAGGMSKLTITYVDSCVGNPSAKCIKKHQITGTQIFFGY
ncbi:hypothetical protein VK70_18240 [Paenibacillus durus ATCC 35681]|uniref:Uncharacterized protein n=1 Tax=Paenibacillus durus ATCC 35681 TaxID=1333534 RepID=A0A0F7FBY3_PAEDU|nr:hypothetical protein VK70_18240 [Paenibacillus durus ATCC 35681]